jgi:DNA-binding transcriptional MerR regulator
LARDYLSIGEVLVNLKPEFPDITISKIRFLESEGLIAPERTTSGYRKFYEQDVDRLRQILKMQRDEYLPLKVIRDRLDSGGDGSAPARPAVVDVADDEVVQMATTTGVEVRMVQDLESYGLLRPRRQGETKFYSGHDLVVLRIVKDFFKYGVEPRHLTMYRHFADREAAFFQAIILPVLRQRNPEARRSAAESLTDLSRTARKLKSALLRSNLRDYLSA